MKTTRQLTFALLIVIICSVLICGIMLLNDPSGRVFNLYLSDVSSIMKNFTPLAWLLIITIVGIGIIATIFTYQRRKGFSALIVTEGIILLLWCIVFIVLNVVSAITPVSLGIAGAALILLGRLIKNQQKDFEEHVAAISESKDPHHSSVHPKNHYHKHRKRGH